VINDNIVTEHDYDHSRPLVRISSSANIVATCHVFLFPIIHNFFSEQASDLSGFSSYVSCVS
jgi:hypothetical protein